MSAAAHYSLDQTFPHLQFVHPPKPRINHPLDLILFQLSISPFHILHPINFPLSLNILKKSNNE